MTRLKSIVSLQSSPSEPPLSLTKCCNCKFFLPLVGFWGTAMYSWFPLGWLLRGHYLGENMLHSPCMVGRACGFAGLPKPVHLCIAKLL